MKVAILAGGTGTRLAEETDVRPKPMVEIGGEPILWHIMNHYAHFGLTDFTIALGYKGSYIKRFFVDYCSLASDLTVHLGDGTVDLHTRGRTDWKVELVDTGLETQTGGRIKRLAPYLTDGTFMLTWGDGVSDVDLTSLLAFHRSHGKLATMTAVRPPARFGHIELDGDEVAEFSEKPQTGEGWINGAFFVLEPEVLDYIDGDLTHFEREPLERLAKDRQLMAFRHYSFWQCMDTIRDKQLLQKLWDSGQAPWNFVERPDMKVLVTGHRGYIGTVLVPMLLQAGHTVTGIDSCLFDDCLFGPDATPVPTLRMDIREVQADHVRGNDVVMHLAAISNDPLGDLNPECTYDINYRGAVHLAQVAKEAGTSRFLQSSSCSLYGSQGDALLDEHADFNPVTPYGHSKVLAEKEISAMADDNFSPTFLRNATAYGVSPRLRGDLVVNNLTGYAYASGEVLMKSDGSPWRPLVHIEDISRAFLGLAGAPRETIHNEAFNVGSTKENYQVRDVAKIVEAVVDGSTVTMADQAGPDLRNYRVSCAKLETSFPELQAQWTVRKGVEQLLDAYREASLTTADLTGSRLQRIRHITDLLESGRLGPDLRWRPQAHEADR